MGNDLFEAHCPKSAASGIKLMMHRKRIHRLMTMKYNCSAVYSYLQLMLVYCYLSFQKKSIAHKHILKMATNGDE